MRENRLAKGFGLMASPSNQFDGIFDDQG
ncbi:uncharacterized protein METZ01_LOCUS17173 [marine metagenome]|uniref:Uncharacterized protein n=1 Tax=marine metagenome TaxID=408172 RepID=A0A381PDU0_9ZZZZ